MPINYCITTDTENIDPSLTVPNVVLAATLLTQPQLGGYAVSIPALGATWDIPTNPYVYGIMFEWTPTTYTPASPKVSTPQRGAQLEWKTTDGIVSEATYSCRWRAVGIKPNTFGLWSTPVDVTIDTQPTLTGNLAQFLWTLQPNLQRFDFYVPQGAVTVIDPFTPTAYAGAFGDEQMALLIPAGATGVIARRSVPAAPPNRYGLALTGNNGGMYNHSFMGRVASTTLDIGMRFVDRADGVTLINGGWYDAGSMTPTTGPLDKTFTLTTTEQTFPWSGIYSDDPAWVDCILELYIVTPGAAALNTDFMLQNDNYFDRQGMETPWRPSPDEDNLQRYGPLLYTLWRAILTIKKNYSMRTNKEGNGQAITPGGPPTREWISGSISVAQTNMGAVLRLIDNGNQDVTFPAKGYGVGDEWWNGSGVITVRQVGTGLKKLIPAAGVSFKPPFGGSLNGDGSFSLRGPGDGIQAHWAGETLSAGGGGEWDLW